MYTDDNATLLGEIFKSAKMGMEAIDVVAPKVEDPSLKADLNAHSQKYSELSNTTRAMLNERGHAPKDAGPVSKAALWGSVQLNTLTDHSGAHVAELMINGSTMGIVDMTKKLKEYTGADQDIKKLAEQFIQQEQASIERMKTYLQ